MALMAVATGCEFGEISVYPVGSTFVDRVELARSGVYPPRMKGISGSQIEGAEIADGGECSPPVAAEPTEQPTARRCGADREE